MSQRWRWRRCACACDRVHVYGTLGSDIIFTEFLKPLLLVTGCYTMAYLCDHATVRITLQQPPPTHPREYRTNKYCTSKSECAHTQSHRYAHRCMCIHHIPIPNSNVCDRDALVAALLWWMLELYHVNMYYICNANMFHPVKLVLKRCDVSRFALTWTNISFIHIHFHLFVLFYFTDILIWIAYVLHSRWKHKPISAVWTRSTHRTHLIAYRSIELTIQDRGVFKGEVYFGVV